MKTIFDNVSYQCSRAVTKNYSTSFSLATKMLAPSIRQDIYNIYGFVRLADEIVDTFHEYNKEELLTSFENSLFKAIQDKISLNPILNSFQHTYHMYNLDINHINSFLKSMKMDLHKENYLTSMEYKEYIYGSADVVGLMCLKVFVNGNHSKFEELKDAAMSLGSAFQKVNFLRDLKTDLKDLKRSYFPNADFNNLNEETKKIIIEEIENDFRKGYEGILNLPVEAKFGVYTAYRYYKKLLQKLKSTPSVDIMNTRIRIPNYTKLELLARCYVRHQLNFM
ncbi:phytoene/squalene synthase family protein [Abyssalbus ytuae]|uniref:Phytoene/squalene synthase family protein n=1 Tax=Abyssalbus ytuae TaxID=2926907 RepID=A0A9E7CTM2_9FLAO|nr:phytoene/squalene synthase family protein [Abyssalbus ytuae]UOB18296.1 phytoene/squalene synthase family protein [Abyssalbus ytuae]